MRQKKYHDKFKKKPITNEHLKKFMESHRMTVSDIAMYLGCTRNTINNYLEGKTKIPHAVNLAIELYILKN